MKLQSLQDGKTGWGQHNFTFATAGNSLWKWVVSGIFWNNLWMPVSRLSWKLEWWIRVPPRFSSYIPCLQLGLLQKSPGDWVYEKHMIFIYVGAYRKKKPTVMLFIFNAFWKVFWVLLSITSQKIFTIILSSPLSKQIYSLKTTE